MLTDEQLAAIAARLERNYPVSMLDARVLLNEVERLRAAMKGWEADARRYARNADYYRRLLVQVAEPFGDAARTTDGGTVGGDVLCSKVPEMVQELRDNRDRYKAALEDIRVHALRWKERKESQAAEWDYLSGSPFASQLEVVYALLTVLKKHGWVAQEVERAYRGEEQGAVGQ